MVVVVYRREVRVDSWFDSGAFQWLTNIYFKCKLVQLDWRESNISGFVHLVRLGGEPYVIHFGALGVSTKASFNRAGKEFTTWRSEFLKYVHETCSSEWWMVFD